MKKERVVLLVIIIILLLCISAFIIGYNYNYRNNSNINVKIETVNNKLLLSFNENKLASIYEIYVKNQSNEILFNQKVTTNNVKLDVNLDYGENYQVSVIAYNDNNERVSKSEVVNFVWDKITFDKSINLNNKNNRNYIINVKGNINNDAKIQFYVDGKIIYTENIKSNSVKYPSELFKYKNKEIKMLLISGNEILDENNLIIDENPINDVIINNPIDQGEYSIGSINVTTSGGEGSDSKIISLYEGELLIYSKTFKGNSVLIPQNYFNDNTVYKMIIDAYYNNVSSTKVRSDATFMIKSDVVNPVYVDSNTYVKYGKMISLNSKTQNATIMYTLDGTVPSLSNGFVYTSPIKITAKTNIKAVAYNEKEESSIVTEYEFIPREKPIKIYVSPSKQEYNKGVLEVGYTTEAKMMNKLADVLIPKLESYNYIVYRNNPATDINTWAKESKKNEVDLHLALHSNGSVLHDESGVKTYIDAEVDKTYSLANLIQDNLVSVYYNKSNKNNGVSYARGRLGECRPNLVPFGILLEIGYHDDYNDAKWIVNNMEEIADAIVKALNQYYY